MRMENCDYNKKSTACMGREGVVLHAACTHSDRYANHPKGLHLPQTQMIQEGSILIGVHWRRHLLTLARLGGA